MPSNAVVIDLAIGTGGNVQGSQYDQVIQRENGVLLVSVSGYPKKEPRNSSEVYSECVVNLITEIMSPQGEVDFDNKWIQELWVTHEGQRNNALYDGFNVTKLKNSY